MKWSKQADKAVLNIPFFIRGRVKKRVEEEASKNGSKEVLLEHVVICHKRFLGKMEDEVKGYSIETCFGSGGCPNRVVSNDGLVDKLEENLLKRDLKEFLKKKVKGELKLHHEFRISLSDCPNACSRPQITDIGLIGASRPEVSDELCNNCRVCVENCKEKAIYIKDKKNPPLIDFSKCLYCGKCIKVCPTGTLKENKSGYRMMVGGKLGRHPKLAEELYGIQTFNELIELVDGFLDFYKKYNQKGEGLGDILNLKGLENVFEEKKDRDNCKYKKQEYIIPFLEKKLTCAMKKEFGDDEKRINHALSVLEKAKEILRFESADHLVVIAAAILHDIGIQEAERKYGSSAGIYQEKEGPLIAERIMKENNLSKETINHVKKIVGNHHSVNNINTKEFKIIWDADWSININDEFPDLNGEHLLKKIKKIFKTRAPEYLHETCIPLFEKKT